MIKLVKRCIKRPNDQSVRHFPAISYSGTIDRDKLCNLISDNTTFTHADVLTALCAFEEAIAHKLQDGGAVKLGLLGTFRTTLRAKGGEEKKKKVGVKNIRSVHIVFTPSSDLNKRLQNEVQYTMA